MIWLVSHYAEKGKLQTLLSLLLLPPLTLLAAMAADAVPREIPKKVSISLAVLVDL